ncbi:MAG: 3-hydroxyacyl-ACP dehydratase FabZ family protein [Planctomycetia bacterium]|nr:3-hydroxyacyl-ACP dehydratase FabZ family protein [Planctomycetia bacterium]
MNWYWIDRFTVFESGKRAQAIKTVSRSEDHLRDHFPFHPVMPVSLIIEGLAQTGGLLIHESHDFKKKVVLGKIPHIQFYTTEFVPGDSLIYNAEIDYIRDEGSMATVNVHRNNELIAEGVLVFAHLGADFLGKSLFAEGDLEDLVRAYGMYDIGIKQDGTRILDPSLKS